MLDMDLAISVYQDEMLAERQARQDKVSAAINSFNDEISQALRIVDVSNPAWGQDCSSSWGESSLFSY